jgi:hypothetical protein
LPKAVTLFVILTTLMGCADLVKRKQALEQEAVSTAITLCKKFGHQQDTPAFTRCAEQRFDEYMVNHR